MKKLVYIGILLTMLLPFQNCSKSPESNLPVVDPPGPLGETRVEAQFYDESGKSVLSIDDGNAFGREVVVNAGFNTSVCQTDPANLNACSSSANFAKLNESGDFLPSGNRWSYSKSAKVWSIIYTIDDLATFSNHTYVHYFLDPDKVLEVNRESGPLSLDLIELSNVFKMYNHEGKEAIEFDRTKSIRLMLLNAGLDVESCVLIPDGDAKRCTGFKNEGNYTAIKGTELGPSSQWVYNDSTRTWIMDVAPEDIKDVPVGKYTFVYFDPDKKDINHTNVFLEFTIK